MLMASLTLFSKNLIRYLVASWLRWLSPILQGRSLQRQIYFGMGLPFSPTEHQPAPLVGAHDCLIHGHGMPHNTESTRTPTFQLKGCRSEPVTVASWVMLYTIWKEGV